MKNGTWVSINNTGDENLDKHLGIVRGISSRIMSTTFYIVELEKGYVYNGYPCISLIESCLTVVG